MRPNTEARFWAKGKLNEATGCIEWQTTKDKKGYGQYMFRYRMLKAHRYAWALANGVDYLSMTWEMVIMHACDNPCCINPAHLSLGTRKDNYYDMLSKGRQTGHWSGIKTHCLRGHEFPESILKLKREKGGSHRCLVCKRMQGLEHRRAKKQAANELTSNT